MYRNVFCPNCAGNLEFKVNRTGYGYYHTLAFQVTCPYCGAFILMDEQPQRTVEVLGTVEMLSGEAIECPKTSTVAEKAPHDGTAGS
jgi:ribosomal protein S27AE